MCLSCGSQRPSLAVFLHPSFLSCLPLLPPAYAFLHASALPRVAAAACPGATLALQAFSFLCPSVQVLSQLMLSTHRPPSLSKQLVWLGWLLGAQALLAINLWHHRGWSVEVSRVRLDGCVCGRSVRRSVFVVGKLPQLGQHAQGGQGSSAQGGRAAVLRGDRQRAMRLRRGHDMSFSQLTGKRRDYAPNSRGRGLRERRRAQPKLCRRRYRGAKLSPTKPARSSQTLNPTPCT